MLRDTCKIQRPSMIYLLRHTINVYLAMSKYCVVPLLCGQNLSIGLDQNIVPLMERASGFYTLTI